MSPTLKGTIFILISSLFYSSYGIWAKLMGSFFDDFFQAWSRGLIILLILTPIGIISKQFKKVKKEDKKWLALAMAVSVFEMAPIFYAYKNLNIGTVNLLLYSAMLIISYLFSKILFKEKLTLIKLISLIIAFVGLSLIFSINLKEGFFLPALGAIIGGITWGTEMMLTKKVSNKYSTIQISVLIYLAIVISNLIFSLLTGEKQILPSVNLPWLAQFIYTLSAIGAMFFALSGFRYVEASIAGLTALFEIIFAIIFGFIVFAEKLNLTTIIGGGLIIIAIVLPNIFGIKKLKKKIPSLARQ